jgi:hypothetical protein
MSDELFKNSLLEDDFRRRVLVIENDVESIPEDQFINAGDADIVAHLVSKHEISSLEIHEDNARADRHETKIRREDYGRTILVDALSLDVTIPYTGETLLWRQRPNPWREPFPIGTVRPESTSHGSLEISVCAPLSASEDAFNQLLTRRLADIGYYLAEQKKHIAKFNAMIPTRVGEFIAKRRQRLSTIGKIVETFEIPLKRRDGVPDISMIPIKRKLVRPLPPAPDRPRAFGIREEDYEHILSVIRNEGRTYETTPSTYVAHDEGGLRDIILAHLNGHYLGNATGETFRKRGKTDIRIEFEDRAAFVAECKIWKGQRELEDAIDQLLNYLTWRDCKGAIVLFNKNVAHFSQIRDKLPSVMEHHSRYVGTLPCRESGEWRYRVAQPEDAGDCITIHVFLFNLYTGGSQKGKRVRLWI